jgi:hypothetical protein
MKRVLAGALLLVMLGGCGGGGDKKDEASATTTTKPVSTTATTIFDAERARTEVTTMYTTFFNPATSVDDQVAHLENGAALKDAVTQNHSSGAANGLTVAVKSVQFQSPELASVNFDILLNGAVVAANTQGQAKWLDGTWKVNERLFCTLLNLGSQHPPRCEQVLSAP